MGISNGPVFTIFFLGNRNRLIETCEMFRDTIDGYSGQRSTETALKLTPLLLVRPDELRYRAS
jgi:hypothetical protein